MHLQHANLEYAHCDEPQNLFYFIIEIDVSQAKVLVHVGARVPFLLKFKKLLIN